MKLKPKRLAFVGIGAALFAAAIGLVLFNVRESIVFFRSPTEIVEKPLVPGQRLRIGGLVQEGSVLRSDGGRTVTFRVTDLAHAVPVTYNGLLPDLFREGQGVVVEGRWRDDRFEATEVLAKHDENYMPPEVAEALKKAGHWQPPESKESPR